MTILQQIPQMDVEADSLLKAISRRQVKVERYEEQVRRLLRKIEWQRRRIRELSRQRTLTLNFTLPGV